MGLSLVQERLVDEAVEQTEATVVSWVDRNTNDPQKEKTEAPKQNSRSRKRTVVVTYTPARRLAATICGVSILGPRVSPGVYRKIFWSGTAKRKRIITLLFYRYLLGEPMRRFTYGRKRVFVRVSGKIVGWRVKRNSQPSYGSLRDYELLSLLDDITHVKALRSWAIKKTK